MNFKYNVQLPSTKDNIFVSEITTGQQKEYLKALLQPGSYEFNRMLYGLLDENIEFDIHKLTLIDKLALLVKLREMSIGSRVDYEFECEACKKHLKHSLDLNSLLQSIYSLELPNSELVNHESYSALVGIPFIDTELQIEKDGSLMIETNDLIGSYSNQFLRDIILFTQNVIVNGLTVIDLLQLSIAERIIVIEKLPAKLTKNIHDKIQAIKLSGTVPILNVDCICDHKIIDSQLDINTTEYTSFLKSIYNENLHNVYQHIYYLTSMLHFTPEYVEKMTPNERELYWSYWHKDQKKKKEEEEQGLTNMPNQ